MNTEIINTSFLEFLDSNVSSKEIEILGTCHCSLYLIIQKYAQIVLKKCNHKRLKFNMSLEKDNQKISYYLVDLGYINFKIYLSSLNYYDRGKKYAVGFIEDLFINGKCVDYFDETRDFSKFNRVEKTLMKLDFFDSKVIIDITDDTEFNIRYKKFLTKEEVYIETRNGGKITRLGCVE